MVSHSRGLATCLLALAYVASGQTIVLEAENGTLNGVNVDTSVAGYSGTGFVSGFDTGTDSVTVSVNVTSQALYNLNIGYLAPFGSKKATLLLNGSPSGEVDFTSTTWANATAGQVLLNAGANTIGVQNDWGWYYVDTFYLTPATKPGPHHATARPVNPFASPEATSLLKYIQKKYAQQKYLLSGQQDSAAISWIETNVGKTPAIGGYDFIEYSPSRVAYGSTSNETENALAWDKRGGITTFVWHWNAPTDLLNTDAEPWWKGFYTEATTFNVSAALAEGPTGPNYKLLLRDIDAIAVQLKRLQATKVPVLFRFLHEAEGGWFWWGAQGPEAAKQLFRLGFNRWTYYHKLNNIIWVWNSVNPDWYPGDDVVDILTDDSYPATGDHGPVSGVYNSLITLGKDAKPVALAEVGSVPDPTLLRAYFANWAYFVLWPGSFTTDNITNPLPFLKQVYNDPYTINLDKLGDFKHTF